MRRLALIGVLPLLWWGCENDTSNDLAGPDGNATDKTCLGCHASEQQLKDALGVEGTVTVAAYRDKDG